MQKNILHILVADDKMFYQEHSLRGCWRATM